MEKQKKKESKSIRRYKRPRVNSKEKQTNKQTHSLNARIVLNKNYQFLNIGSLKSIK